MIRYARWIVTGRLHPARLSDIPLRVIPWIDPVAAILRTLR